jgi:hypothetical protein
MLTLGHLSASYLISQIPTFYGAPISSSEQILIVGAGYVLDLDLLIAKYFVKREAYHHLLPTHTPLFVVTVSTVGFLLLQNIFSPLALFLSFVAMMVHLILDDIGYWFCKLGLQKISDVPQIFWAYPFDKRKQRYIKNWQHETDFSNYGTIKSYLTKAPANVVSELLLFAAALLVFLDNKGL